MAAMGATQVQPPCSLHEGSGGVENLRAHLAHHWPDLSADDQEAAKAAAAAKRAEEAAAAAEKTAAAAEKKARAVMKQPANVGHKRGPKAKKAKPASVDVAEGLTARPKRNCRAFGRDITNDI